jgi:hypothetical protein
LHGSTALFCYDEDLETRAARIYDSGNDDSVEKSVDNDDFYSYYDSLNPCLRSEEYLLFGLTLSGARASTMISSLSTTTRVHQLATRLDNLVYKH